MEAAGFYEQEIKMETTTYDPWISIDEIDGDRITVPLSRLNGGQYSGDIETDVRGKIMIFPFTNIRKEEILSNIVYCMKELSAREPRVILTLPNGKVMSALKPREKLKELISGREGEK